MKRAFRLSMIAITGWLIWTVLSGLAAVTHKAERRMDSRIDLIERAFS